MTSNGIFGSTFERGWQIGLLDDTSWLAALVEVETALMRAAQLAGAVPESAAATILERWTNLEIDLEEIGRRAGAGGNPVIPLAAMLKATLGPDLRDYVHLGATSQDILDTACMLLARRAMSVVIGHLRAAAGHAADLAAEHASTRMAGRTLLQNALPITFGLKAATWTAGLDGAIARLGRVSADLPVQYAGPVGTFSGSNGHGPAIRRELAGLLQLADTELAWHTVRLPIADLAGALGTAAGIVGKVALDVVLLAQSATSEVGEGQAPGDTERRGGSSSMPHKHNPVAAISARACSMRTPGLVATLFAAMPQEHERAAGAWHSEWETLADLLRLTGSAAAWLSESLQYLVVDAAAMARAAQQMPPGEGDAHELTMMALAQRTNEEMP
ncbi:lyase family protein [Nakamurella sp. PAMC28650]|uniref:lyase family protein n=1 Tax=Nakamurella sp. PAMC28650 TaxID=2762325 RepID=UPI00164ECF27|nr:lyase family protein [Nakamurella sp. PAMC28650]QNK80610.1 3-carboxy-cis,cis-muconate cycloisomerase [Nakamurella sp. PAMC28650]